MSKMWSSKGIYRVFYGFLCKSCTRITWNFLNSFYFVPGWVKLLFKLHFNLYQNILAGNFANNATWSFNIMGNLPGNYQVNDKLWDGASTYYNKISGKICCCWILNNTRVLYIFHIFRRLWTKFKNLVAPKQTWVFLFLFSSLYYIDKINIRLIQCEL